MWRTTKHGKKYWTSYFGIFSNFYIYYFAATGYPSSMDDISELGRYVAMVAGLEICAAKVVFLFCKDSKLKFVLQTMNEKSQELMLRAVDDDYLLKLRNTYYVKELGLFVVSFAANSCCLLVIYTQAFSSSPPVLLLPVKGPIIQNQMYVEFFIQLVVCVYHFVIMIGLNFIIGNLYNQLILHLEVLHYDCKLLEVEDFGSDKEFFDKLIELSKKYQSIVHLNKMCGDCFRPLFLHDTLTSMVSAAFCCVEIGIVINRDVLSCLKPLLCFVIVQFMFFYWCWMGDRLSQEVSGLNVIKVLLSDSFLILAVLLLFNFAVNLQETWFEYGQISSLELFTNDPQTSGHGGETICGFEYSHLCQRE